MGDFKKPLDLAKLCGDESSRWLEVALQEYRVSSWAYFNRSYNMFPQSEKNYAVLFYCAFELRCAIERIFYEYFAHLRDQSLSKTELKLWSAKDLKSAIYKCDPDFLLKIEFLNIMIEARNVGSKVEVPDLERLCKDYGILNDCLHAQKGDGIALNSPHWWDRLRDVVVNLHKYAWPYCSEWKLKIKLENTATELFSKFKNGQLDKEGLIALLRREEHDPRINVHQRRYFN